jgi:hypothetical protein
VLDRASPSVESIDATLLSPSPRRTVIAYRPHRRRIGDGSGSV